MRVSLCLCMSVATALAAVGCSASRPWRASTSSPPAAVVDAPQKPAATEKAPAPSGKKESPFVAEREKNAAKAASASLDKTPADTKPAAADKPAATASSKADAPASRDLFALSPETLMLIDSELRDATPEERTQWYEQLKRVEPSAIADILRARRMSMQYAARSTPPTPDSARTNSAPMTFPPSSQAIQPTGYSGPAPAANATTAGFQTQSGYQPTVDPRATESGVVLQGFESEAAAGPGVPIAVQRQPPAQDQRGTAYSEPSSPAVPWPPAPKTASQPASSRNPLAPPLSFGAGLVQNVVGLVPNRGAASSTAPTTGSVQPAVMTVSGMEWRAELARSIAALEQEVAAQKSGAPTEDDVRKQVALRLMYLMADHQERALTAIPGLEPAEQEFWQQLVWGMSNSLDVKHIARPEDRATQTVTQLTTAVRRLQERADLQIRNVAFCKQILYFGNYDRFPRDEFRPGQEVLLYAEIENFKSEPTADGQYRTLLRSSLEILSPSGEVRKQIDFPATEDLCRNYRRDYFHNYQFTIPDRLPLGPHVLKLSVFDELSGKMTSYSLNFLVN